MTTDTTPTPERAAELPEFEAYWDRMRKSTSYGTGVSIRPKQIALNAWRAALAAARPSEAPFCGPCNKPRDPNCPTCGQWSAPRPSGPQEAVQYFDPTIRTSCRPEVASTIDGNPTGLVTSCPYCLRVLHIALATPQEPHPAASPHELTAVEQQALNQALRKSVKLVDPPQLNQAAGLSDYDRDRLGLKPRQQLQGNPYYQDGLKKEPK